MDTEAFESYKTELAELKQEFEAMIRKELAEAATATEATTDAGDEEAVEVPPADVSDSKKELAAVNVESDDEDVEDRFKNLGDALASKMKADRESK
jgi:hypothetical protein